MVKRQLAIVLAVATLAACPALADEPCRGTSLGSAEVAAVRDGRTVQLADGRELRLMGIEAGEDSHPLQALIAGRPLRLERLGTETDRYGRLTALAYAGESPQSLQASLLEQGSARVSSRIGAKSCAAPWLAAETRARTGSLGLWADPNFAPLSAENLPRLAAETGRFALVEGKVLSVRESGATIYVNFGRRWTQDFTVTILKRQQRTFSAAGLEPKRLEGRRVRVRGWIEQRGGPLIVADAPEQIEPIE